MTTKPKFKIRTYTRKSIIRKYCEYFIENGFFVTGGLNSKIYRDFAYHFEYEKIDVLAVVFDENGKVVANSWFSEHCEYWYAVNLSVFVLEEYRNKGVGRSLVTAMRKKVPNKTFIVNAKEQKNNNFYRRITERNPLLSCFVNDYRSCEGYKSPQSIRDEKSISRVA